MKKRTMKRLFLNWQADYWKDSVFELLENKEYFKEELELYEYAVEYFEKEIDKMEKQDNADKNKKRL